MKLLVVDDDRDLVELLDYALRREGYDVVRAYDGESAVEAVGRERPDRDDCVTESRRLLHSSATPQPATGGDRRT